MTRPYRERLCTRRGAPMGRGSDALHALDGARVRLARVPLDGGGYDPGGAYWGHRVNGESLFCAWTPDCETVCYLDARTPEAARAKVAEEGAEVARWLAR